jgi:hypothetical protein
LGPAADEEHHEVGERPANIGDRVKQDIQALIVIE